MRQYSGLDDVLDALIRFFIEVARVIKGVSPHSEAKAKNHSSAQDFAKHVYEIMKQTARNGNDTTKRKKRRREPRFKI